MDVRVCVIAMAGYGGNDRITNVLYNRQYLTFMEVHSNGIS